MSSKILPAVPAADDSVLENYERYLRELAASVTEQSHFGGRMRVLGGKTGCFLYQEIPGLDHARPNARPVFGCKRGTRCCNARMYRLKAR